MSETPEQSMGRKEPSGGQVAGQQDTGPIDAELEAAGTAIDDLEICWRSGNKYHVWSERQSQNAYLVDLGGDYPFCTCEHGENNVGNNAACRHIKKAITVLPSQPHLDTMLVTDLVNVLGDVYDLRDEQRRLVTGLETDAAAGTAAPAPTGGSGAVDVSAAAERLQDAYDEIIEDMQVKATESYVWVQTGKETPEELPGPGSTSVFDALLRNPEQVDYVNADDPGDWVTQAMLDEKPGEWWKNVIDPSKVDSYIDEVLG